MLTRYVIFEKTLPPAEIIRLVGDDGAGRKTYSYVCDNCDAAAPFISGIIKTEEYCKSCSRTFSKIKEGVYMRPGVYITQN